MPMLLTHLVLHTADWYTAGTASVHKQNLGPSRRHWIAVQVLKGVQEDPGQLLVIKASEQVEALQRMGLPSSLGPAASAPLQLPLTVPFTHMVPQMVQYTHR